MRTGAFRKELNHSLLNLTYRSSKLTVVLACFAVAFVFTSYDVKLPTK